MIAQRQLEEMVHDMTVGAGESDVSLTNLLQMVEKRTGTKLNAVQERIVQRALQECQTRMEFP